MAEEIEDINVGGEETGIDMEAAIASIADGLGFAEEGEGEVTSTEATVTEPAVQQEETTPTEPISPEEPATATEADPAPKTWRPEAAKVWSTLPPEAKAEILKREEDMFKGLEGYKADATIGKAMKEIITPFMPALQQHGIDPAKHIHSLLNAHQVLSLAGPEQKLAVFQRLAQEYGVPMEGISGDTPYIDPQIQALNKTIDDLRSRLDSTDKITADATREKLRQEIDTFASDPKNAYFDEVASDIAHLLQTKVVSTLQEAYEKAIWMNPVVREKEVARLAAEKANLDKAEATKKAEAAKKATAANVKTTPKQGRGTAPLGSMDDTLKETLAAIKSK
jgi:hypothetical protein